MNDYGLAGQGSSPYNEISAKDAQMPSMKLRLSMAVKEAESKLADAKRAKEILDKHPELEELLNIMQRRSF